jgi:hypothetical protein
VLDSLPLEPQHEQLIGHALYSISLFTDAMLDAVDERASLPVAALS